ncbi:MAG TPA: hypothetical protein VMS55_11510 [Myxococcota bacterium]|nr:hypothetical protein [Myxococcota bacterium]
MHHRRVRALALFVLALASCAGHGPKMVEQGEGVPSSAGPRVVVAPLNLGVELASDFEDAVPIVELSLIRSLQRRGARVAVIWTPDAVTLWRTAVASVAPEGSSAKDYRAAADAFEKRLAQSESFDMLLIPSLALRPAKLSGRTVRWDGVQRRLRVEPAENASLPLDSPVFAGEGVVADSALQGHVSGLSLHLLALRPGRRALERWGGLDLVHDAVPPRGPGTSAKELEPKLRHELLEDPLHVDEGVALALDPIWSSLAR